MRTVTRFIAWIAGIALLVIVGAGSALLLFFDPNDYKPEIISLVKEHTGRELSIPGKISVSLFPWLGVKLGEAQLSNAPGFGKQPFAAVQSAQLHVKLLPLLKKQVEVGTISLRGLTLRLGKDKAGKTNWDDLVSKEQDKKRESPLANLSALAVGGVDVRDATIIWEDKASGASYTVSQLALRTGALADKRPFDLAAAVYQLLDTSLKIEIARGKERLAGLDAKLSAALPEQTLTLSDITLTGYGITASGALKGEKLLDAPAFAGMLKVAEFSPRDVMNRLGSGTATMNANLAMQGATGAEMRQTLSGNAAFSFTGGAVKGVNIARLLRDAQVKLKGGAATASGAEPNQTDFSELTGTVTLAHGVARNEDLSAKSPLLRVSGKGSADLVNEQMDYLVHATVVASLEGQGGKGLEQLKGLTVPIRISGPFANLSYRPDVQAIVKGKVVAPGVLPPATLSRPWLAQDKLDEKKQDLQQRLQDKLKNLFQ